jgi:hypothetical protein
MNLSVYGRIGKFIKIAVVGVFQLVFVLPIELNEILYYINRGGKTILLDFGITRKDGK